MAFTFTERADYADTSNAASYTTTAYQPAAAKALVAFCQVRGSVTDPGSASGNGLTWANEVTDVSSGAHMSVWSAPTGSSPTNTGFTIDVTGDNGTAATIWVVEVDGADVADIVAQVKFANGASGTPAVTFDVTSAADCAILAYVGMTSSAPGMTEPSGYTESADQGVTTPDTGHEAAYHASPGAVDTVTWGSSSAVAWRAFIVELNIASVGAVTGSGTAVLPPIQASGDGTAVIEASASVALPSIAVSGDATAEVEADGSAALPSIQASGAGTTITATSVNVGTPAGLRLRAGRLRPSQPRRDAMRLRGVDGSSTLRGDYRIRGNKTPETVPAGTGEANGSGSVSLPSIAASGEATAEVEGSGVVSLPTITASGTAAALVEVTGVAVLPSIEATGTATVEVAASGTIVLPAFQATGTASTSSGASGNISLPSIGVSGQGAVEVESSGSISFAALQASGAGTASIQCEGSIQLPSIAAGGDGAALLEAASSIVLPAVTATGELDRPEIAAEGSVLLPALTASGEGNTTGGINGDISFPAIQVTGAGTAPPLRLAEGTILLPAIVASGAGHSHIRTVTARIIRRSPTSSTVEELVVAGSVRRITSS